MEDKKVTKKVKTEPKVAQESKPAHVDTEGILILTLIFWK